MQPVSIPAPDPGASFGAMRRLKIVPAPCTAGRACDFVALLQDLEADSRPKAAPAAAGPATAGPTMPRTVTAETQGQTPADEMPPLDSAAILSAAFGRGRFLDLAGLVLAVEVPAEQGGADGSLRPLTAAEAYDVDAGVVLWALPFFVLEWARHSTELVTTAVGVA